MIRRDALKNIGWITGGVFMLPYACDLTPEINYSNFPLIKKEQQELIGAICKRILTEDFEKFPTPEPRGHFVLTMVNDCLDAEERAEFSKGFEAFQSLFSLPKESTFQELLPKEQEALILENLEDQETELGLFLNQLKTFSLLHFETSENYMKNYLNFEFMPGRYLGKIAV